MKGTTLEQTFIDAEIAKVKAEKAVNDAKLKLIENYIDKGMTDMFTLDMRRVYQTNGINNRGRFLRDETEM